MAFGHEPHPVGPAIRPRTLTISIHMRTHLNRRVLVQGLAASLLTSPMLGRAQSGFPNKPLRIIVPFPPGGAVDISMRVMGEVMQTQLNQTLLVDNRPGGAYMIGLQQLTSAAADGHTLLHVNSTMSAVQVTLKRLDMLKQMTPVACLAATDGVLCASSTAPFKTLPEMITWAKAHPGQLTYGSIGQGSLEHLFMLSLGNRYGFKGLNVPFKGGADGAVALAQNEIQVMVLASPLLVQWASRLRVLAALGEKRNPLAADAPTLAEARIDSPTLTYWGGVAAPLGTPRAAVESLQKLFATALELNTLKARYLPLGLVPRFLSADDFTKVIDDEVKWLATTVKGADLNLI